MSPLSFEINQLHLVFFYIKIELGFRMKSLHSS